MTKEELALMQKKVTILRAEGKYKETIENCYELLEKGMHFKDYKSVLTAYMNLIASYYCIGDIKAAFNIFPSYEEACEANGDETDILSLFNIMFLLYEYNKEYSQAKETLEKSIELGKKLKKYNIVSNGYSNYSHVCIIEKDYIRALEMASHGIEYAKIHEPATRILEIRVKLNLAKAHIGLNNLEQAGTLVDEMIKDPILDGFPREKSQCYDLQGHWYSESKLYKEAFQSFTSAKVLVESYKDVYLLKSIQEERCRLCEIIGDINSGYEVQKEYIALLKEISEKELALTALKLELELMVSSLVRKINIDPLTGIYNRNYIETTANKWLKEAAHKNEEIICLVFDVDHFKAINDGYGHLAGDEIIKLVSKVCLYSIGEEELFGRYGGDEFIIILKDSSLELGKLKAEQILESIRALKVNMKGKAISITVSIGVADNSSNNITDFKSLFNAADMMLYKAKKNGRNQVCGY